MPDSDEQYSTVEELSADLATFNGDLPVRYVGVDGTVYNSRALYTSDSYGATCVVVEITEVVA